MLIFTTEPLDADFICVGYVSLIVYVKTSLGPKFDIFGRLCDVDEKGESLNVCDGLQRNNSLTHQIVEEDEESKVYEVKVDLWATGKLFKKNHRIRLQVARFIQFLNLKQIYSIFMCFLIPHIAFLCFFCFTYFT